MARPVLMPKLGLTMTEGVIALWKVAPGSPVKAGETMFVVETDKISNEIEAVEDGTVEALHAREGETVQVGAVVATLAVERIAGDTASPPAGPTAPPSAASAPRPIATPLARRLARHAGLDIAAISGSGPRGRISAKDVTAAGATRDASTSAPPAEESADSRGDVHPLGAHQAVIARRLTEAKRDIPHFYLFAEADVTALLDLRSALNAQPNCAKISVNHFIVTALARALADTPGANVVWTDGGLRWLPQVDVGIAIDTPKGLVAPVLPDIGGNSVDDIAQAAARLVGCARAARLSQGELRGGASSVSNVGMFGATALLPIVNPGQSSILGVGRSQAVFRPDANAQPALRHVLQLGLSCDHRVIDGALAARFLQKIQHGLEAPLSLLRRPIREAQR